MARICRPERVRRFFTFRSSGKRQRVAQEVEQTMLDGFHLLRLVYRSVELIVDYHKRGETDEAFAAMCAGARALAQEAARVGWNEAAASALIVGPIETQISQMYDEATAYRSLHAFNRCFERHDRAGVMNRC
jgi:hypothetical protein